MKKITVRTLAKIGMKGVSTVCVDGFVCGSMALCAGTLGLVNPIIGGLIVVGGTITAAAVCDKVVNDYIEETVDYVADMCEEAKECVDILTDKDEKNEKPKQKKDKSEKDEETKEENKDSDNNES